MIALLSSHNTRILSAILNVTDVITKQYNSIKQNLYVFDINGCMDILARSGPDTRTGRQEPIGLTDN